MIFFYFRSDFLCQIWLVGWRRKDDKFLSRFLSIGFMIKSNGISDDTIVDKQLTDWLIDNSLRIGNVDGMLANLIKGIINSRDK